MEEDRAEVDVLQRKGQRSCREAFGNSHAILGDSKSILGSE